MQRVKLALDLALRSGYHPRNSAAHLPYGAALAQLVEHVIRNDGVAGSSPACGTKNKPHPGAMGCQALSAGLPTNRSGSRRPSK